MGQTLTNLSRKTLSSKAIFNNRFVNEICENVHFHYRNLRILLSLPDWISLAQGCSDALARWKKMGEKEPGQGTHVELCRKEVAEIPQGSDEVVINLNKNLYPDHDGRIFSEGADFEDAKYIHFKVRDLRIELSLDDFSSLADCVAEAKEKLCQIA